MTDRCYIAIDLGASSGRVMEVRVGPSGLRLTQRHRFTHRAETQEINGQHRLCWDLDRIMQELVIGLGAVDHQGGIDAIGIDSWGVDYGLIDKAGELVAPVTAYRDLRHHSSYQAVREQLGSERIYEATGIQFQPFNTLYQLATDARDPARPLERADRMLMMPDLVAHRLCGSTSGERTNASTTQCFDSRSNQWCHDLLEAVSVPASLMPEVRVAGESHPLGILHDSIAMAAGLPAGIPVMATATHDTAAAVVAAPLDSPSAVYISSGTWSLVGVEQDTITATSEAMAFNFTNEAGAMGTTRLLKNVAGLWLLQECRRTWESSGQEQSWSDLVEMAGAAAPFQSIIDPDHADFASPGDMPSRIRDRCRVTGEPIPGSEAEVVRCILDSLALRYASCVREIEQLTGSACTRIVVVGGGARNQLLNQLTADVTNRPLVVGSTEATALGNALMQHAAVEGINRLADVRALVPRDEHLEPEDHGLGSYSREEVVARFERIVDNGPSPD
ncbi:MAG: rhamnulokinase [Phycisphaerales bacterium]|nr:rhamnulokinase [Phycisphaerales bacterium]